MGLHHPFEYLQHKLYLKEGSGLKMSIWFLTIRSQESLWFMCVQGACHILLEKCQWGLQLCVKPRFNWRSTQEVMGVQNDESPNFEIFGTLGLGVPGRIPFGCSLHGEWQKLLQGVRWWLPLSLGRGESCESMYACDSFVHQKCSNYALTNLLFGLCRSIWIIDPLIIRSNPHFEALAHPFYPSKWCEQGSVPNSFRCIPFETHMSLSRGFGVCRHRCVLCSNIFSIKKFKANL
jgi:hypothetical protein